MSELISTLEETALPIYTQDYLENYTPHYPDEKLPGLIERVLSLVNQYHTEKVGDKKWKGDLRNIYHQLDGLFRNYKKLKAFAVDCPSYSEFEKVYRDVVSSKKTELKKRPIKKKHATFFGPNESREILDSIGKQLKIMRDTDSVY